MHAGRSLALEQSSNSGKDFEVFKKPIINYVNSKKNLQKHFNYSFHTQKYDLESGPKCFMMKIRRKIKHFIIILLLFFHICK